MGITQKVMAISTALLFSLSFNIQTGAALAGDYYPPQNPDMPPQVTVVEFGTGWYLRGNIGYSGVVDPEFTLGGTATGLDLGNAYSFGVGAGYQYSQFLRGEFSIDQLANLGFSDRSSISCGTWDHDGNTATPNVPVTGSCMETQALAAGATAFMVNAYLDLGNYGGFTPYLGAGVGGAYVRWEDYTRTGICTINTLGDCQNSALATIYTNNQTSNTQWKPAGSVMAGFSYDLTRNLKFDMGYKFTYISGGSAVNDVQVGTGFSNLEYESFNIHQINLGFRYEIW